VSVKLNATGTLADFAPGSARWSSVKSAFANRVGVPAAAVGLKVNGVKPDTTGTLADKSAGSARWSSLQATTADRAGAPAAVVLNLASGSIELAFYVLAEDETTAMHVQSNVADWADPQAASTALGVTVMQPAAVQTIEGVAPEEAGSGATPVSVVSLPSPAPPLQPATYASSSASAGGNAQLFYIIAIAVLVAFVACCVLYRYRQKNAKLPAEVANPAGAGASAPNIRASALGVKQDYVGNI
jgi:hypothetical protein